MKNYDISKVFNPWLQRLNMPQSECAKRVGVSRQTISHFATGQLHPTEQRLNQIANALRITPTELLCGPPVIKEQAPPSKKSKVEQLFDAFCKGCPLNPRGCRDCVTKRLMDLCRDVADGKLEFKAALRLASGMVEDNFDRINERHDREAGFMQPGHAGG